MVKVEEVTRSSIVAQIRHSQVETESSMSLRLRQTIAGRPSSHCLQSIAALAVEREALVVSASSHSLPRQPLMARHIPRQAMLSC